MQNKQKISVIFLIILIMLVVFNNNIYANTDEVSDATLENYFGKEVSDGGGFFYESSGTIYFYRVNSGRIVGKDSLDTILKNIKTSKYQLFVKSAGDEQNPFPNTKITDDKFSHGKQLSGKNIYSDYESITSKNREDYESSFEIQLDNNTLKAYLPSVAFQYIEPIKIVDDNGSVTNSYKVVYIRKDVSYSDYEDYGLTEEKAKEYQYDYNINFYSKKAIAEIEKAVQEGIVAGSVETGYNVGSVYSDKEQLPLNNIMEEIIEDGGKFYKFKDNVSINAGLDYFYNPLFGKMLLEDGIPETADEWNNKAYNLDISKGYLDIDEGYKSFVSPMSEEREGIFEVSKNLKFTNGVEEYSDDITSKQPKKLVTYNLSIGLPNQFSKISGKGTYQFQDQGLYVLEGIKMSVWNDTIYDFSGEKKEVVCTNNDIDLQRDYLVLYHHLVDGKPVGVVIPLKYSEVVVDTREKSKNGSVITQEGIENSDGVDLNAGDDRTEESGVIVSNKLYLTGRTVVLDNSYSKKLNIDEINRDVFAIVTKIHGSMGVEARKFAFPFNSTPTMDVMLQEGNHRAVEDSEDGMSLLVNFIWNKESTTADDPIQGFVILRNNMYVQDGSLIDWLRTQEAQGIPNVKAKELEDLIRGVFTSNDLSFFDWMRIKDIESELNYYKSNSLYRVINIFLIVMGTFFIVFGILIILAYWFDVFNTFTDFSILYMISFKSMYPIMSADIIPQLDSSRRYVTFKDIMLRAAIYWIIGALLFENQIVFESILKIYMYISRTIGGI